MPMRQRRRKNKLNYVNGFKSRDEFTRKSARSYDDERRRLENWLGDYMHFRQTSEGKNVFLSFDSRVTKHNPLFRAWKTKAVVHPVSDEDMGKIIKKYAFSESIWAIPEAIKEEKWQLLKTDGTTPITHEPTMPLTVLQKRWLKSIGCDPRLKLFGNFDFNYPDVEPLFLPTEYIVFDKCSDGDDYTDDTYISNFRLILDAIIGKYSEKDDKFRLIGAGNRFGYTINLGHIISCKQYENWNGYFFILPILRKHLNGSREADI